MIHWEAIRSRKESSRPICCMGLRIHGRGSGLFDIEFHDILCGLLAPDRSADMDLSFELGCKTLSKGDQRTDMHGNIAREVDAASSCLENPIGSWRGVLSAIIRVWRMERYDG
jgi:hypothetical protein